MISNPKITTHGNRILILGFGASNSIILHFFDIGTLRTFLQGKAESAIVACETGNRYMLSFDPRTKSVIFTKAGVGTFSVTARALVEVL